MADSVDIDKALIALKKGAQLLKYGRNGKPKFCPFRLSNDESTLIWVSKKEKSLKLSSVSKIVSGQRTVVFQRFLLPEKDHLSFSLIYNDGKRSLDLVCKDKAEAETWFTGLNVLLLLRQNGPANINRLRNGGISFDNSRESSLSSSSTKTSDSLENKLSPNSGKDHSSDEFIFGDRNTAAAVRTGSFDFRFSVSSALSSSSHGSGGEDSDSFGDVYVWGEVICDGFSQISADGNAYASRTKADVLIPKPLESDVMLDVNYLACGVKHSALITRQAELFTWGDGCGGQLGHGVAVSLAHPRLVESLSSCGIESISCGEFHTCAVTSTGELYSWGDSTHCAGILGHGSKASHWLPKRVVGPLEGIQVSAVSCGTWHSAIITTSGQLYTFGDGTFGVLGHGNHEAVLYPKEVESLKGLRAVAVSCGVWHTAAVIEVIMSKSSPSFGKLFTWGDGDKHRLGHDDKATRLIPTCVSSLIDYNFQKVACGHTLTVGLTTSGHVFTMGSPIHGQLGNPRNDGKLPKLVEDKIGAGSVAEVACGAYHVAVLTSAGEVYTWGKGANGRLGHGDTADCPAPTLVEALRERAVRRIACGSNFTAAICQHKWVSGVEQSQCTACKLPFGLTRKRHNCYNCGLVHCHTCSLQRSLRAALSPNPGKPYRVCGSCYNKLNTVTDSKVKTEKVIQQKSLDGRTAREMMRDADYYKSPTSLRWKDIPLLDGIFVGRRSISPSPRSPQKFYSGPPSQTVESLREENEHLKIEIQQLIYEVNSLRDRRKQQGIELQKSGSKIQEAMALVAEKTSKSSAAQEIIKSLRSQLREMSERLQSGAGESKQGHPFNGPTGIIAPEFRRENQLRADAGDAQRLESPTNTLDHYDGFSIPTLTTPAISSPQSHASPPILLNNRAPSFGNLEECPNPPLRARGSVTLPAALEYRDGRETERFQINFHGQSPRSSSAVASGQVDTEWIEQYEPGVYVTLVALRDGSRALKRVRFSLRRFGENDAETWWTENRDKVLQRYNVQPANRNCQ